MASWPTFDLANFATDYAKSEKFRNQAISFVFESGSTMKPLMAGAGYTMVLPMGNTY